jgi:hypothetical protein
MSNVLTEKDFWRLPAGTVIRVNCGFYDHVAMLGDGVINGERSVLSFAAGTHGLAEISLSAFAARRPINVDGYLSALPPGAVMQRARLKREATYSWLDFNCEHFVRYAHGLPIESPQLQQWSFLGGVVGVLALMSARA